MPGERRESTNGLPSESGNSEILHEWLLQAIENRYEPAYGALERFLLRQGRRKFLKPLYEKLAKIILEDAPILYLYHPRMLIAHTTRLEGYRQMADGLVRVVGLKLK